MITVLLLGIVWILYGLAGLLGFQFNPKELKGKPWLRQYNREQGIAWLLLGAPWCVLYLLAEGAQMKMILVAVLLVVFALPSIYYAARIDRKYKARLQEQNS